jgi:hypothetical protein
LNDELVGLRNETLTPGEPVSMVFELAGGRPGVLRAHLDVPGDLLPADDEAFAVLGTVASRAITLVGGDALSTRVLAADPRVQLSLLSPSEVTAEGLAGADAVFFLAGTPPTLDGLNMAVLTRRVPGPAELGDLVSMPEVVSWERSHPVNRFVDYQGSTIARSASMGDLGGLVPIVSSDTGPLVLAGERGGGRVVQFAFDPFESDLPMRVAWPVLLLNSVGWLTERAGGAAQATLIPAGSPFIRPLPGSTGTATVTGPTGTHTLDLSGEVLRVVATDAIGVYRVRTPTTTLSFAANLLSPRESRITPAAVLAVNTEQPLEAEATLRAGRQELWRPLLALALFLLLVEWFAYNRRKSA